MPIIVKQSTQIIVKCDLTYISGVLLAIRVGAGQYDPGGSFDHGVVLLAGDQLLHQEQGQTHRLRATLLTSLYDDGRRRWLLFPLGYFDCSAMKISGQNYL